MKKFLTGLVLMGLVGAMLVGGTAQAATGGTVLIYGPSLTVGPVSEATIAAGLGYTVTVADAVTWAGMTAEQFGSFDAIIFGDDYCGTWDTSVPQENLGVWSRAVDGPIVISAPDSGDHVNGGSVVPVTKFLNNAIGFAGSGVGQTGLYVSLGCNGIWEPAVSTPVAMLKPFGDIQTMIGGSDIHTVALTTHPVAAGLTDADMSNWGTTSHLHFTSVPADFDVVVKETGSGDASVIAHTPSETKLTLKGPKMVAKGHTARIRGRLSSDDAICVPHRSIKVKAGGEKMTVITNADGIYRATIKVSKKTKVKVVSESGLCLKSVARKTIGVA